MSEAIHCPECNKKYSLPANPPATFTCRQCNTLMDLSDFGGQDAPAEPARKQGGGPPRSRKQRARGGGGAPPPPSRGGGGRASRGSRGGRGGGAPAASRGRGGRRGAAQDDGDDGRGGRRGGGRGGKDNNNAVIIGSLVGLLVVVGLVVAIMMSKDDAPVQPTEGTKTAKKEATKALTGLSSDPAAEAPTAEAPKAEAPKGEAPKAEAPKSTAPAGEAPKGAAPKGEAPVESSRLRNRSIRGMKLQKHAWPDEVDTETRTQVDEAVAALYRGGRDSLDAREFLEAKGRPIAGRLISEFKVIQESPGFEGREGASLAGIFDSVLRTIDGWQERRFREQNQIRATSQPSFTLRVAQRWTAWWVTEEWKNNPRKPWDPHEDSFDEQPAKKGAKKKGSGFRKRAGG
ncbi:MAG: hypothetical protein P1V36_13870 [Planctomycetota bacterium]|nr:hypothetical protein [Planctomycetota bacterium]